MINQLNARSGTRGGEPVPFRDLKYLFGEIMYGGHIVDPFDRRTNVTYLDVIITDDLFNADHEIFPGFKTFANGTHEDFLSHVQNGLPNESPISYGMHPNAEINFLMTEQKDLFDNLLGLGGGSGGSGGGGKTRDQIVGDILEVLTSTLPEDFNMFDLKLAIGENITPYLVVLIQESERFNVMLREIRQDLKEMRMGLDGALNITDKMEKAMDNMIIQKVAISENSNLVLFATNCNLLQPTATHCNTLQHTHISNLSLHGQYFFLQSGSHCLLIDVRLF